MRKKDDEAGIGWRGIRSHKDPNTTISILLILANWTMVLYAISELGTFDEFNNFKFDFDSASYIFYIISFIIILFSFGGFFIINYKEIEARFGAIFLISILPFITICYFIYLTI